MKELKGRLFEAPPEEIRIPSERIRKEFAEKDMEKLVDSIRRNGQKTPGICRLDEDGVPLLVAGERRLRACSLAGRPFLFRLEEEVDPVVIFEIELEENVCRKDITWQEEASAIAKLHKLKQEQYGESYVGSSQGWSQRDTARKLEKSVATINEAIELHTFAENFEEIKNAKTKSEAKKLIKALREQAQRNEAIAKATKKRKKDLRRVKEEPLEEDPELRGVITIPERDLPEQEAYEEEEEKLSLEEKVHFYEKKILHGRMEDILPTIEDPFDVVFFDPPWGVGLDKSHPSPEDFQDDEEFMKENLPKWLELLYSSMADNSHLYMFFGIVHHEFIYSSLLEAGFIVNKMPLIWHKSVGSGFTRAPDVWPGRTYEPIAYARKGRKALVKKGAPDVITTRAPIASMKKGHPSAKHPDIYLELIKRSCLPGDRVLDPMCGSGMFGVAAEALGVTHALDWTMIEENRSFRNLSIINVIQGMYQVTNPQGAVNELPEDFRECSPGTWEWKQHWKNADEEKQKEMLEWKKNYQEEKGEEQ